MPISWHTESKYTCCIFGKKIILFSSFLILEKYRYFSGISYKIHLSCMNFAWISIIGFFFLNLIIGDLDYHITRIWYMFCSENRQSYFPSFFSIHWLHHGKIHRRWLWYDEDNYHCCVQCRGIFSFGYCIDSILQLQTPDAKEKQESN